MKTQENDRVDANELGKKWSDIHSGILATTDLKPKTVEGIVEEKLVGTNGESLTEDEEINLLIAKSMLEFEKREFRQNEMHDLLLGRLLSYGLKVENAFFISTILMVSSGTGHQGRRKLSISSNCRSALRLRKSFLYHSGDGCHPVDPGRRVLYQLCM